MDSINVGAEMFVALNVCPSDFIRLYWKLIYGRESRIAILASNMIKKTEDDRKIKAIQVFEKITSILGFQHISSYNKENGIIEKRIDVKGET